MEKFLKLNICLSAETGPKFGINRLCFEGEKPNEGPVEPSKKKPVNLSEIGDSVCDEESQASLEKAKTNRAERKEVDADTKDELAALRASLGPLPGSQEAEKKKKEEEEKEKKKKEEEEKKKKEGEKKGKEKKPGVPERAPDAMTGSQFAQAFDKCKNQEERQKLILEQAGKGAFSPESLTPKYYETVVDGKKVRVKMLNNIEFGVPGDSVKVNMDGETSQAIADMLGGTLPSADFYRRVYNDPNVQKIPFFYGGTLEAEWRRRGENPSAFHTQLNGNTVPSGRVMRSGEYMAMHSQMQDEWIDSHGVDRKLFMVGGRKTVFAPDVPGAPDGKIVFGGGLYAVPYQAPDPDNPGKTKTEYRVDDTPGKYVQGIGDHAHEPTWHDYAAGTDVVLAVEVEGKEVPVKQFMTDEKYEGTRKALFGPGSNIENRYNLPPWMQGYVEDYQKKNGEFQVPKSGEGEKPIASAKVFDGISAEDIQKGKVVEEYDYTVAQGAQGGHVKFVKTSEGDVAVMSWQGKEYQVKVDLNNASGVDKAKQGYGASGSEIAGPFAYVMLRYFREHGNKVGDMVPFEYNGQQYVAEYQIHNDGPNGPIPYDHPGVGIMMKKETDTFSGIPRISGVAQGPVPVVQPQKTGDAAAPQKPADLIAPPPKVGGGSHKVATGGGGPSYGGGVPSYQPASYNVPSYSPAPGPVAAYQPPYVPPAAPDKPKQAPVERKEGTEYIIRGSTLFVGDSNTTGAFNRANINVEGEIDSVDQVGITAGDLLRKVREYEATGKLDRMKNMVVTAGVNGIGLGAEKIFASLMEIWRIGKKHGLKVYAGTLAPFEGWSNFGSNYGKYNETRKQINAMIRRSQASEGIPDAIIPYDELVADPNNPDRLDPKYEFSKTKPDHLHFDKRENARIVASIVGEPVNKPKPGGGSDEKVEPAMEGAGGLADFEKSPYFDERTKTYAFPEGDPQALRIHINAPGNYDRNKPTRVVMFALPAGNTIEQTIGAQKKQGQDWHFEIQQIGAQTRKLRETSPGENIVIAYIEAPKLNPGGWHKDDPGRGELIGQLIQDVKSKVGAPAAAVDISGHSAGRSFEYGYIDALPQIPDDVKRLSFLDSNHSFNEGRTNKIMTWLQSAGQDHYLTVIAYDDRNIRLNGQPVPGAVGYERTIQMIEYFQKNGIELTREQKNGYVQYSGLNGRVNFLLMDNPDNKILHTETVYRNGFTYSETAGTPLEGKAGQFNGPLSFGGYVQESPANLQTAKPEQPKAQPELQPAVSRVEYKVSQGAPGGVISFYPNSEAKMTYQDKEYALKVDTGYQTPDLAKPPEGYSIRSNPSNIEAVIDYAMLYTMLQMNKPQGTEMPFEYNGVKYLAKLAWHTDHPGADLYIKS